MKLINRFMNSRKLRILLARLLPALLAGIILVLFLRNIFTAAFVIVLFLLASFSKIYKRVTSISLGFELITPVTILFAFKFGIMFASSCALLMLFISEIISGKMNFPAVIIQFLIYIVISTVTVVFGAAAFIPLAIVMIVFRNVLLFFLGYFLLGTDYVQMAILCSGSVFFNSIIITSLGGYALALM